MLAWSRVPLVMIIVSIISASAVAGDVGASTAGLAVQAPVAPPPSPSADVLVVEVRHLEDEVAETKRGQEELRSELDATQRELGDAKAYAIGFGGLSAAAFVLVGIVAFFKGEGWLRDAAQTSMKQRIEDLVASEFPRVLQERMRSLENEAQTTLLKTAQVLALHASKKHDEAIAARTSRPAPATTSAHTSWARSRASARRAPGRAGAAVRCGAIAPASECGARQPSWAHPLSRQVGSTAT